MFSQGSVPSASPDLPPHRGTCWGSGGCPYPVPWVPCPLGALCPSPGCPLLIPWVPCLLGALYPSPGCPYPSPGSPRQPRLLPGSPGAQGGLGQRCRLSRYPVMDVGGWRQHKAALCAPRAERAAIRHRPPRGPGSPRHSWPGAKNTRPLRKSRPRGFVFAPPGQFPGLE